MVQMLIKLAEIQQTHISNMLTKRSLKQKLTAVVYEDSKYVVQWKDV